MEKKNYKKWEVEKFKRKKLIILKQENRKNKKYEHTNWTQTGKQQTWKTVKNQRQ